MQMLYRLLIFFLIGTVFLPVSHAQQDVTPAAIDAVIAEAMQTQPIPGLALAVMQGEEVIYTQGYGVTDVARNTPVTPATLFESASLGKQFTAAAMMVLVEEGAIDLDASVQVYIPELPTAFEAVTIRHLLTHTAGLAYATGSGEELCRASTYAELLDADLTLRATPGERYEYSDLGYQLLGLVIERVTGQTRGAFLQAIFDDLELPSARPIESLAPAADAATGYFLREGRLEPQACVDQIMPGDAAGGVYVSADDLSQWVRVLRNNTLLTPDSITAMWTPVTLNDGSTYPYGFGWAVRSINDHPVVEHSGVSGGFSTHLVHYPADDLTIIVLTNLRLARTWDIAYAVAALYDPTLQPTATVAETFDPEPEVAALLRDLLQGIREGTLDRRWLAGDLLGMYDDIMSLQPDFEILGDPVALQFIERTDEDALRTYRYRVIFNGFAGTVVIQLDEQDKITNLEISQ